MKDLTLQDPTQLAIFEHLKVTEELLAMATSKVSGRECVANIWAMPDLGLPFNVSRIHGGFFTGALYSWETFVPFVPVDATVNSCGVSVFRLRNEIHSKGHFDSLIAKAIRQTQDNSSYLWNFASGNHFIIYGCIANCANESFNGHYVVMHSSASEFKDQYNGLYPVLGNWYYPRIQTVTRQATGRSLSYIEGRVAERFIELAQHLEQFNKIRHRYFAELIFGEDNIEAEISNQQHYGMPFHNSIAIGCQWLKKNDLFVLLTAPERPIFFFKAHPSNPNSTQDFAFYPHGLGVKAVGDLEIQYRPDSLMVNQREYALGTSLKNDKQLCIRTFTDYEATRDLLPEIVNQVLRNCPATYVAKLEQVYSYYRKIEHPI